MSCNRVAVYTATVAGVTYTYKAPVREGVEPPASIFRQGNFYELHAVLTSEPLPVTHQ